jgi:hypothetical protein
MKHVVRILVILIALSGAAWRSAAVAAPVEDREAGIVVELYRAIVHIAPHDGPEIEVTSRLIDYDAYADSGLPEPTEEMVQSPAPQVLVERTPHGVHIGSPAQREMIEVTIEAPVTTSSRIDIVHQGEIFVDGMDAPIEINVFKGRILLTGVRRGVAVDVQRDADVAIHCDHVDAQQPILVGSYDGKTQLFLPIQSPDVVIDARSHLGTVTNDSAVTSNGNPATIILRTVRGDIEVHRE